MAEMLTYEQTLTSTHRRPRRVPHGVLALRRGAGTPARQDHRRVEGRTRRSQGRRRVRTDAVQLQRSADRCVLDGSRACSRWPLVRRRPCTPQDPRRRADPFDEFLAGDPCRGAGARHQPGHARRGAHRPRARTGRRGARSRAAGADAEPRRLRRAAADRRARSPRPASMADTHGDLLARVETTYGVPRAGHGRDLGPRVELRQVHRHLSDHRGARDAGLRRPPAALPRELFHALAIVERGDVAARPS